MNYAGDIFNEHEDLIRSVIYFHVKDKAKADDIYQDIFISIATKSLPKKLSNTRGYLYRVINNEIIDTYRQNKGEKLRLEKYANNKSINTTACCPDVIVSKAEKMQNIFAAVETKLCKREVKAVKLKYQKGYTSKEAAKKMGINRQSFNGYITSSVKKLRAIFRKSHND